MAGYVALIALFNLALGYALAVYLRRRAGGGLRQFISDLLSFDSAAVCPACAAALKAAGARDAVAPLAPVPPPNVAATPAVAPQPAAPIAEVEQSDPATGFFLRDTVDRLLADLTAVSDPLENPASVVLVELDPVDAPADFDGDRLLAGIANTVRELLDEAHSAARYGKQQLLLLLPGDDESAATQRTERLRQRVEATEFLLDKAPLAATVSCAMGQLSSDYSTADIVASLQATLNEAKRMGGNRTYLYDGLSPSPVVPPELNLAPQTCAI